MHKRINIKNIITLLSNEQDIIGTVDVPQMVLLTSEARVQVCKTQLCTKNFHVSYRSPYVKTDLKTDTEEVKK